MQSQEWGKSCLPGTRILSTSRRSRLESCKESGEGEMLSGAGGMIGVQNFVGRDVRNAYAAAFH